MIGIIDRRGQMTIFYPSECKRSKEVVQETFLASYKHIIPCSHHTQKERRQIGYIEFLHKIVKQIVEKYGMEVELVELRGERPIPPTDKKDKPT